MKRRTPCLDLFTEGVLAALTATSTPTQLKTMFLGDPTSQATQWTLYWNAMESARLVHLSKHPVDGPEMQTIIDGYAVKMEWVLMDHDTEHYQHPLPFLTPDVIRMLVECVEMIPNALAEVSGIYCIYIGCFCHHPTSRLRLTQKHRRFQARQRWRLMA